MKKGDFLDVEMHVNDFAKFMFRENINDSLINISLGGIENTKDLFFFCLDLFCKGLTILFGAESEDNMIKVDLENLSYDNFNLVKRKLGNAGISVNLSVYPPDIDTSKQTTLNFDKIEAMDNNLNIKEYNFIITTPTLIYKINFELVHNV